MPRIPKMSYYYSLKLNNWNGQVYRFQLHVTMTVATNSLLKKNLVIGGMSLRFERNYEYSSFSIQTSSIAVVAADSLSKCEREVKCFFFSLKLLVWKLHKGQWKTCSEG